MSVVALKPYSFPAKDVRQNFPAPLIYIGWEDHLMFCAPYCLPLPPDTPFGALSAAGFKLSQLSLLLGALGVGIGLGLQDVVKNFVSGLILMFARGMSEFGAVIVVAYHPMITPVLIYERFGAFGLKYARPVSVLFILISLALFIVLRWMAKEKRGGSEVAR